MTRAVWERVCAAAKPGDVLRTEGRGTSDPDVVSVTGRLVREGRVLRTVCWTAPLPRYPRERDEVGWEVHDSDSFLIFEPSAVRANGN